MRIPFPERLKWKNMFVFAVVLFVAELAAGTDVRFASLVSVFIFLFTGAVNQAGGLYYPSGAYIFFNGVLICILGVSYKTFVLWEPGESHLSSPYLTMMVYCGGMASMWGAVALAKRLCPRKGFLSSFVNPDTMMQSAIGCFVLGNVLIVAISGIQGAGSIGAALNETNRFPQFAIMLGTLYAIRSSNGRRAWNWVVIAEVAIIFYGGVVSTSKEGMFLGPVTWLVTAAAYRYDFRPKLILGGALFMFFMVYYMVPYSQYVRTFRDKDYVRSADQATALTYLFHLNDVRALYKDQNEATDAYDKGPHFYDKSQGLLDRLAAISMDDALVNRTDQGFVFGLYPTYHGFINVVPTFIWPSKPFFFTGNEYGRELQVLGPDDLTTGISFSPQADAFHEAKWFGIFAVLPLVCFLYFLSQDSFVGSAKDSPWPLLLIILASHIAPEGGIDSMLLQLSVGTIGTMFMALVIRFVLPLIVRLVTGNERTVVRATMEFRPNMRPLRRAEPAAPTPADPRTS